MDSHHGFVVEYGKDWDVDLGRCLVQCMSFAIGVHLDFLSPFYACSSGLWLNGTVYKIETLNLA